MLAVIGIVTMIASMIFMLAFMALIVINIIWLINPEFELRSQNYIKRHTKVIKLGQVACIIGAALCAVGVIIQH